MADLQKTIEIVFGGDDLGMCKRCNQPPEHIIEGPHHWQFLGGSQKPKRHNAVLRPLRDPDGKFDAFIVGHRSPSTCGASMTRRNGRCPKREPKNARTHVHTFLARHRKATCGGRRRTAS
jgi:hypothetical protein